jgi:hypothetical protein
MKTDARVNGKSGKTERKINLKQRIDTVAVSKVKPSLLKHFQIKLLVV